MALAQTNLRIAFYIGSLEQGGSERHVVRLLEALPRAGFSVDLVLNIKSGPFLEQVQRLGIEPTEIRLEATTLGRFRFVIQLAQYLRDGQFDILQSYNDISMFYAGLATILAQ
ncbi:MAG: glycosyltransferase, partial [Bacteroidetes bacterium]|nr:glycosyltransferase [Bacteroidota bacterium]